MAIDEKIFQVPATVTKIVTMTDGLRLFVDTQELTREEKAKVFSLHKKLGWFVFKETELFESDLELPDIPQPQLEENQKSKSAIQRSCLFVLWEKRGKKDLYNRECDFDSFYNQYMNQHIDKLKLKIQELEK